MRALLSPSGGLSLELVDLAAAKIDRRGRVGRINAQPGDVDGRTLRRSVAA